MADQPIDPQAERFYDGAYRRIAVFTAVLAVAAMLALARLSGWRFAGGFALGALVAAINFVWLKQAVSAMADRITQTGQRASSSGVVVRFLLRYLLIGLGAYVIFKSSVVSVYGLLAGLFVPVAAMVCEAGYELYVALRRGL
jgi:ATP synthase I subunit